MPRTSTTLDPFSAVAEPRRRDVLATLLRGERPVGEIVDSLGWPQPQVSKHLAVLREVGLVRVRREGRRRLYSVDGRRLKPIHDWIRMYEKFWENQLDRIKARAENAGRDAGQNQPRKD